MLTCVLRELDVARQLASHGSSRALFAVCTVGTEVPLDIEIVIVSDLDLLRCDWSLLIAYS